MRYSRWAVKAASHLEGLSSVQVKEEGTGLIPLREDLSRCCLQNKQRRQHRKAGRAARGLLSLGRDKEGLKDSSCTTLTPNPVPASSPSLFSSLRMPSPVTLGYAGHSSTLSESTFQGPPPQKTLPIPVYAGPQHLVPGLKDKPMLSYLQLKDRHGIGFSYLYLPTRSSTR